MGYRYEIITGTARLIEVEPAWRALWDRAGAGIFQSYDWLEAWWRTAGQPAGTKLRVGAAWDGSELVAVLPLAVRRHRGLRLLEWAAQSCSDYCDALIAPTLDAEAALRPLWSLIRAPRCCDIVQLQQLRPDARCVPFLDKSGSQGSGWRLEQRRAVCLRLRSCWPSGDAWFRSLNKKTRNNHLRAGRVLAGFGEITSRQYRPDDSLPALVSRMGELKRAWLAANERRSEILDAENQCLQGLVGALAKLGALRLFLTECDGKLVAGSVNAIQGDTMMAYFAAYDPAYERASPGTTLMVDYTMWALDHGIAEIDYLRGEEPYKFKFANGAIALSTFRRPASLLGSVALRTHSIKDRLARHWASVRTSDASAGAAGVAVAYGSAYRTEHGTPRVAFGSG